MASARFNLHDSTLDDVVVFYRCGDERGAVVTNDYSVAADYLGRLRSRRTYGSYSSHMGSPRNLGTLIDSGTVLAVESGRECLGMMRPLMLGGTAAIRDVPLPFLIACERDDPLCPPRLPILAASREAAIDLVRRLHLHGAVNKQQWRDYPCERLRGMWDGLVFDLDQGRPLNTFKTELERKMWFAMHPPRARKPGHAA